MKSMTISGRSFVGILFVSIVMAVAVAQVRAGSPAANNNLTCDHEVFEGPGTPIQTAITAAAAGQTICVHGGTYHEIVKVPTGKTNLTLIAAPGETPIIDGQKILPGGLPEHRFLALVELNAVGTVLDGFEVRFSSARGVDVTANNIIVRNSSVHDNWSTGINVRSNSQLDSVLIENNHVYRNMRRAENTPVIYRAVRSGTGQADWTFDPDTNWDNPFWTGVNADMPEQWLSGISMTFNNDGVTDRVYAGSPRSGRAGYIGATYSKTGQEFSYSGADILFHEPSIDKWTLYFDGDTPDDIPPSGIIDAFQIESTESISTPWQCPACAPILMSFTQTVSIPIDEAGVVTNQDIGPSDLVRFSPSSIGPQYGEITGGSFSVYLRASEFLGLPAGANIDALDRAPDGRLLLGFAADLTIGGLVVDKEDLVAYDETLQTWELYFDGDLIPFNPFNSDDLTAAWVDYTGNIYISGNPIGGSALTLINTLNSTARGNTVHNNFGEGLVSDRFSVGAILEGNTVYDNLHANLYLNSTTNPLVRGNLVYCTTDRRFWAKGSTQTYRPSGGIQIRDENFDTSNTPPPSSGQVIINNIVIGCGSNFGVASQPTVVGGGLNGGLVANNVFANARGDTIPGVANGVNNIELSSSASYANSRFINNLILQSDPSGAILRVQGNGNNPFATFTVANNLYSVAPPASWFSGEPGRVVGNPQLAVASPPVPAMGQIPDANDYRLTYASPALDAGQNLGEVTIDFSGQTRAGAGPTDIGAFELPHIGQIIVVQESFPAGSPQAFDFTTNFAAANFSLTGGQQQSSGTLQAGTYSVASAPVADWTTTAACSDGSPATAIVLAANETVTCTFTSVRETRLIVNNSILPAGDPQQISFNLTPGNTFQMGNASQTFVIEPGAYALTATIPGGWQQSGATCDNGDNPNNVTLDLGEWVTCSFAHRKMGRIIVSKQTVPPNTPSTFQFTATYGSFSLSHGQSHDSGFLTPGVTYSITEAPLDGWAISNAVCAGDDDGTSPAAVLLDPGETVTCTFTNSRTTSGPLATFYVTTPKANTVRGLAYSPGDILAYNNATDTWSLYFDASDVGITKALNDFVLLPDGSILMAFKARVKPLDPAGNIITIEPHDITRFIPTRTGSNTDGRFELYFDGSDVALSTSGEKIDALAIRPGGVLLISTSGAAAVKNGSTTLKAADEDLLAFQYSSLGAVTVGTWSLLPNGFDGSTLAGMAVENVTAAWRDAAGGNLYLALTNNFKVTGISGTSKTVLSVTPAGVVTLYWDAATAGFPGPVDGLHIQPAN